MGAHAPRRDTYRLAAFAKVDGDRTQFIGLKAGSYSDDSGLNLGRMTRVTSALTRERDHLAFTAPLLATLRALAFTARLFVFAELFVTCDTNHVPTTLHQHDLGCVVECLLADRAHVLELVLL